MSLKGFHKRKKNEFVSIDSVVGCISRTENLSLSDAILSLYSVLNDEEGWNYIYRNETTQLIVGECRYVNDHPQSEGELFESSQQACLSVLVRYSRCFEEPNFLIDQLVHTGWYKSEIKQIFNDNNLQYLDCFDDEFYSPTIYMGNKKRKIDEECEHETESIEPDWEHYAKLPYLTENECACLLANVNPELYSIIELDHNGHVMREEHKLPSATVNKVEKSLEIIKRHTNLGLNSASSHAEWIDGKNQYTYYHEVFVEWASENKFQLNSSFLANSVPYKEARTAEYLDVNHPCYSPKLAAAIEAWQYAVSRHGESQKTPTQNIEKWLSDNKNSLTFNQSKQTNDSIARVANFRSKSSSMTSDEMQEAKAKLQDYQSNKPRKKIEKLKEEDSIPF